MSLGAPEAGVSSTAAGRKPGPQISWLGAWGWGGGMGFRGFRV